MKPTGNRSARARGQLALAGTLWLAAVLAIRSATVAAWAASRRPAATADDAVAALAGSVALLLLGWLALAALLTALAVALPRGTRAAAAAGRLGDRITPAVLRRSLAVVVGAALLGGMAPAEAATPGRAPVAAAATATPGATPGATPETGAGSGKGLSTGLDPGWGAPTPPPESGRSVRAVPEPPSGVPELDPGWGPRSRMRAGVQPETAVVVRRGDTLWDLAARHLGPAATDAQIAQAWPAWFITNRDLIGPDPDRLHPGQRLTPPAPAPGGSA